MDPEVRGARKNAFCERQDAFYVEFIDGLGVVVDLRQRQLFAELVTLAAVGVEVDRFRVQERLVESVEFQANGFEPPFLLGGSLPGRSALLLPNT